jgi:hypothetical protein
LSAEINKNFYLFPRFFRALARKKIKNENPARSSRLRSDRTNTFLLGGALK